MQTKLIEFMYKCNSWLKDLGDGSVPRMLERNIITSVFVEDWETDMYWFLLKGAKGDFYFN